jgi:hypothetical protein
VAVGLALLSLSVCCFGAAAAAGPCLGFFSASEAVLPPPYPDSQFVPFAFVLVCPAGDGGTAVIMESTRPVP